MAPAVRGARRDIKQESQKKALQDKQKDKEEFAAEDKKQEAKTRRRARKALY